MVAYNAGSTVYIERIPSDAKLKDLGQLSRSCAFIHQDPTSLSDTGRAHIYDRIMKEMTRNDAVSMIGFAYVVAH